MKIEKVQASVEKREKRETLLEFFLARQLSPRTREAYKKDLEQFWEFTGRKPLEEISPEDGIAFRAWLLEQGLAPSSVNRKLSALRSLFKFAVAVGKIKLNPFAPEIVQGFKRPKQIYPDIFTKDEIRSLLRSCADGSFEGMRDELVILLGVVELLRASEMVALRAGDIKEKYGVRVLELRQTKSGVTQYVKLRDDVYLKIKRYLEVLEKAEGEQFSADSPLLRSLSNNNFLGPLTTRALNYILEKRLKKAEILPGERRLSIHSLRHTGITLALEAGADLLKTYRTARHSDPKTTMRYYHGRAEITDSVVDLIKF